MELTCCQDGYEHWKVAYWVYFSCSVLEVRYGNLDLELSNNDSEECCESLPEALS